MVIGEILLPFSLGLLCVWYVHPWMVRIAELKDIVDEPSSRKLQRRPVPILGGVCVFLGAVVGLGSTSVFGDGSELFVVVMAMTVMLYTGTMDDILGLTPRVRFMIEIATVVLLIVIGHYRIDDFHGLWGLGVIPVWISVPLTVFASVGIINAINLIDGVDGLSSGYCILACVLFGALFYLSGDSSMTILDSATNENLQQAIEKGNFREDLYHRINEFTLRMPALKERQEDILLFANFFLDQANRELDRQLIGFDAAASQALQTYSWPGNLRQLKNIVKRATLLAQSNFITLAELGYELQEPVMSASPQTFSLHDEAAEKKRILEALKQTGNNKSKAAILLGIDRKTLYNKLKLYDIQ